MVQPMASVSLVSLFTLLFCCCLIQAPQPYAVRTLQIQSLDTPAMAYTPVAEIADINEVPRNVTFQTNQMVIVPINCYLHLQLQPPAYNEKPLGKKFVDESQDFLDSMSSIAQSLNLKVYKFEELQVATDNFSPDCQIKGSSVYRGLVKGDFAAIKKVHGDVSKEIELLNTVNHSNLIRLSGVCFDNGHWYLVYEYAANGALSDWIYNNNKSGKYLTWRQRIQVASDIATGLNYLHILTNHPHVHKDLKCSNVLLDGDFRAKITNFALARSTEGEDGQFALTKHIVGTKGYMALEYVENGMVSTKIDVYAFGVLLLEVISGKEAAAIYGEEHMKLSEILRNVVQEKDGHEVLKRLIDPCMLDNYPLELAILVVNLINSCLTKEPNARPAMDEIVHSLSRILTASPEWESSSSNTSRSQTSSGSY
ncbi:hypothetical protein GQ457_05G013110 [Hibiscus cannabinus]